MHRFNFIGMWIELAARGSGVATQLVDVVKARATAEGFDRVFLDVSPDNAEPLTSISSRVLLSWTNGNR